MKLILFFLVVFFSKEIAACEIPLGEYQTALETHSRATLKLMAEGKFEIEFASSMPARPGLSKFTRYTGNWFCDNSKATFSYWEETVTAEYQKSHLYPLAVYKDIKAIIFPDSSYTSRALDQSIYWPVNTHGLPRD